MCGIVGLYAFGGQAPHRERWPTLVNHMRHRGPDDGAFWADGPFFFGHRRLSIIDLGGGDQPMATADGALVVTFNGEIYNYLELRAELEAKGHRFRTHSDTEVLLHGYREWGVTLPEHLTGMFAFALADRRARELFLARDRFGEKPLLVARTKNYIAFASELRPLAALPDFERRLDVAALGGYLCLNYVPGTRTLLAEVTRLAPGSWALWSPHGQREGRYWVPPEHAQEKGPVSLESAQEEFRARFDRAVALNLRSDVPVGLFLSGGIDSALVAEAAQRHGKLNRAFCIGFQDASFSEKPYAETVARKLGLELETIVLTPNAARDFLTLVEHADDPLADSSALPVYALARVAARHNKVVLGGDGGDELNAGYLTYKASRWHAQQVAPWPGVLRRGIAGLSRRLPTSEGKVSFSFKLRRFLRAAPLPTGQAHFTWNGTWLPEEAAELLVHEDARCLAASALREISVRHFATDRPSLLALQRADAQEYLPNDILTKTDRMTMAHGLEIRAPFLEHDLAEWLLRLPDALKIGPGGKLKFLLRSEARRIFGSEIADRPKQGFSVPIHAWVRGDLQPLVRDLLTPAALQRMEVFDARRVTEVVEQHMTGQRSFGYELWGLAVLSAWFNARVANRPPDPPAAALAERTFPWTPA